MKNNHLIRGRSLEAVQSQNASFARLRHPCRMCGRVRRESIGIDSLLGGWAMPKAYSEDMRARVIAEVESGASRRAAAEEFDVSTSTAIIWVKCFRETGRCTAKPRGGSVSPLEWV